MEKKKKVYKESIQKSIIASITITRNFLEPDVEAVLMKLASASTRSS